MKVTIVCPSIYPEGRAFELGREGGLRPPIVLLRAVPLLAVLTDCVEASPAVLQDWERLCARAHILYGVAPFGVHVPRHDPQVLTNLY